MKITYILVAAAVTAGGMIATIKVPNTKGSERILADYRSNPQLTIRRIETAIFECVPDSAKSPVGLKFTKGVIAPLYLSIVDLRLQGAQKDTVSAQVQKWIITYHPKLLTDLPDGEFLELVGLLQAMGEDKVENCILASTTSNKGADLKVEDWGLRS